MADRSRDVYAEYAHAEGLIRAIRTLRGRGYASLEAHTPYPIPAVEDALELPRSRLPLVIAAVGLSAAGAAYALQYLLVAYLYPLNVGGRPPHMPLAFLVITFEMGVLGAAFAGFFGLLVRARLLRLWDPVFELDGFDATSIDRYWLRVGAPPPGHEDARESELERTEPVRLIRSDGPGDAAGADPR